MRKDFEILEKQKPGESDLELLLKSVEFDGHGAPYRDYEEVKGIYNQIEVYADERGISFEKACTELNIKFTSADKWVMVMQAVRSSNFTKDVNTVTRDMRFKYSQTEKRIRILILIRDEALLGLSVTVYDIVEKWLFPPTIIDQTLRMVVYLSALMRGAGETEARKAAHYLSNTAIDSWRNLPEFKILHRAAIDRSIAIHEERLGVIANSAEMGAPQVAAGKYLIERLERQKLADLYDTLDAQGRIKELSKRAFILAAEKGSNLREALKLHDPEKYGEIDDVNLKLPQELLDSITPDAPTVLLLQMQKMLEKHNNNTAEN